MAGGRKQRLKKGLSRVPGAVAGWDPVNNPDVHHGPDLSFTIFNDLWMSNTDHCI